MVRTLISTFLTFALSCGVIFATERVLVPQFRVQSKGDDPLLSTRVAPGQKFQSLKDGGMTLNKTMLFLQDGSVGVLQDSSTLFLAHGAVTIEGKAKDTDAQPVTVRFPRGNFQIQGPAKLIVDKKGAVRFKNLGEKLISINILGYKVKIKKDQILFHAKNRIYVVEPEHASLKRKPMPMTASEEDILKKYRIVRDNDESYSSRSNRYQSLMGEDALSRELDIARFNAIRYGMKQ